MNVQLRATGPGDGPHLAPDSSATQAVTSLPVGASVETELDAMVSDIKNIIWDLPDEVMRLCQAYMARCTELNLMLVRVEGRNREAKFLRTQQLARVIDLIEFTYKAASRSVEIRRQDVELSK